VLAAATLIHPTMRLSLFSSVIALALTVLVVADDSTPSGPSEVLDLSPSNFDSEVKSENIVLVEFFAPWCGHCKALAPHYDEASVVLKEKGIKLAKVDCVEHGDLCQQHGVSGYPTLKVFRNGTPTDYTGPRKADGIISYMLKQSLPAVTDVNNANFDEFKKADKLVLIAFLSSASDDPGPQFKAAADSHRDDYLFGLSTDSEVFKAAGVAPPAIVLYRSFDDPEIKYTGAVADANSTDIEAFLKDNQTPLLDEVSQENYAVYAGSGLPLAYLFVDPEDSKTKDFIASVKPVALKSKGKVNFVSIDAVKFADHAKALNLDDSKWPGFVIQDLQQQHKFPLSADKEVTAATIGEWTEQYIDGKLEPMLKSEPIPESQDESVVTLVGKSFESVVFDDDKDVLVEFYAPWCGHCKRLKPTWDSLGDRYVGVKDKIVIAKIDATENDLPASVPFRVSGFPTIKFKPAGSRDFLDYEGDRSLESLIEFVESKAKNSLDLTAPKASVASEKITAQSPIADIHDEL